jgi:hypothetical protein
MSQAGAYDPGDEFALFRVREGNYDSAALDEVEGARIMFISIKENELVFATYSVMDST